MDFWENVSLKNHTGPSPRVFRRLRSGGETSAGPRFAAVASPRRGAVTFVDLLAALASVTILLLIAVPHTGQVRELSKRAHCATNLAVIGAAETVYASANGGSWTVPGFSEYALGRYGIDYLAASRESIPPMNPGEVGSDRALQSTSDRAPGVGNGSYAVSVSRAYWMLVRSGDVSVRQFVCPSSGDAVNSTTSIELYYDFESIRNISYGFQVPFGPPDTRARDGMDNRVIVAADRSPFYFQANHVVNKCENGGHLESDCPGVESIPRYFRFLNSRNHWLRLEFGGQNVLRPDLHVAFERTPLVGADHDNIYTVMGNNWDAFPNNVIWGKTPHTTPDSNPYPGQGAFGADTGMYSTTDSLLYP